jgi:hypothetical protein
MKVIRNKYLPPEGYKAMTVGPLIFVRGSFALGSVDINHETIHWEQQKEMLIIPFFLWYVIEFIIKYIYYGFKWHKAYRSLSFEREAYFNQEVMTYLNNREPFEWIYYIKL